MELTKNEKKLIEAIRELDTPPYNILLWYTAGIEHAQEQSKTIPGNEYRIAQDQRQLDIANAHLQSWDK